MLPADRAEIYQALAEVLADPPEWIGFPGCDWPIFRLFVRVSSQSEAARGIVESLVEIKAESLFQRRKRYAALFGGQSRPLLWLYESAALHGRPFGRETFALGRLYAAAGLTVLNAELPDHASLELAFLAYLSERQAVESDQAKFWRKLEVRFIRQHAGRWLPDLGRALASSGDMVYAPIGKLLYSCLDEGMHTAAKITKKANTPCIHEAETCTLCGFCVQTCPTQALAIRETAAETTLMVNTEECIGCYKCEHICEMEAIKLSLSTVRFLDFQQSLDDKGWKVLRCSPRSICPGCGAPTVSVAEMDYVAAKLEHPAWLGYCQVCRLNLHIPMTVHTEEIEP